MIKRSWLIALLLAGSLLGAVPHFARAATTDGLVIKCDIVAYDAQGHAYFSNPCGVDSFIKQFIVLTEYGLSIIVVLSMLMMVYGGFQFVTAGGRPSKVDEGKRVILGTIIGLIISMTAFVIVNFTVAAITGSGIAARSINPFGAIAHVFSGDKTLDKAFNNTGKDSGASDCKSLSTGWDKDCTQVHCADAGTNVVQDLQNALNNKSCTDSGGLALSADGCFGPKTEQAVRKFQVANDIPPTGQYDSSMGAKLTGGNSCSSDPALVDGVTKLLAPTHDSTATMSTTGCCVVKDTSGQPAFCGNNVSQRTCDSVDGSFTEGACATSTATRDVCGYCADSRSSQCFQTTTSHWCTDIVRDRTDSNFRMTFTAGRNAEGEAACSNGWSEELLNLPP